MDVNGIKFQPNTSSLGAGVKPQLPTDNMGVLMASEYLPRYSMAAYSRQIFTAANTVGVTGTALVSGTTVTLTGFAVSNPVGSLVNLHVLKVGYACTVAPAGAGVVVVAAGFNSATNVTHSTPITNIRNSFMGLGATGYALADSVYTLPTAPNTTHIIGNLGTNAVTALNNGPILADIEGSLILPPGGYMIVASLVASGAAGAHASASWVEIPI